MVDFPFFLSTFAHVPNKAGVGTTRFYTLYYVGAVSAFYSAAFRMGKERGGRGWLCSRAALGSTAHEKSSPSTPQKRRGKIPLLVGMEFDKKSTAHEII